MHHADPIDFDEGRIILTLRAQPVDLQAAFLMERLGLMEVQTSTQLKWNDYAIGSQALLLGNLGVAEVAPTPKQRELLRAFAAGDPAAQESLGPWLEGAEPDEAFVAAAYGDDGVASWGIHATRAVSSALTGAGVRVAILDTGLPTGHAAFGGRIRSAESFVPGLSANDSVSGHGLACAGIAAGGRMPADGRRIGVATEADIYIGRVLGNNARGMKSWTLRGISWALQKECRVVSMSLASPKPGTSTSPAFERAGQRAVESGALLIAAAGNYPEGSFVGEPANANLIIAVGAVDSGLNPLPFSPQSDPARPGAAIDFVGPGHDILSFGLTAVSTRFRGTSMATAYVAGLAALHVQASRLAGVPAYGMDLKTRIAASFVHANGPVERVGRGLVVAP